jgi:ribosome-associated toxin RatA of RatAB toxin-antitoxin module
MGGVRQSFTTRNENQPGKAIDMRLVEGPFRQFAAAWRFSPLSTQACRIDFSLQYEFSSRALARLLEPLFDRIADTMVDAFARRADEIYGHADR